MPRNSKHTVEELRQRIHAALFASDINGVDLRTQALRLVEANLLLRELGTRLLPHAVASAKQRIIEYLRLHVGHVIEGDELMVVAGISEYARRIRELRVQEGWPILSGITAREMRVAMAEDELPLGDLPPDLRPDQYLLQEDRQDKEASQRWALANDIRRQSGGVQAKLLRFFRSNVGQKVTSEELKYVAGDASEWARRTRELRTEEGWPIVTKFTGDPNLPMGTYVLARDEQAPVHDRHIPEIIRRDVMRRDDWTCRWTGCGWSSAVKHIDPRFLEAHHIVQHAHGGLNDAANLVTLCNLHHDEVHRSGALEIDEIKPRA